MTTTTTTADDRQRKLLLPLLPSAYPLLWSVARRLHRRPGVRRRYGGVWDVFQELVVSCLANGLPAYDPSRGVPLNRWLARSASRDVLSATRYQKGLDATRTAPPGALERRASPDHAGRVAASLDVAEALRGAPEEYRQILRLRWLEGLDLKEAAAALGRSHTAATKLHARAFARLCERFGVAVTPNLRQSPTTSRSRETTS